MNGANGFLVIYHKVNYFAKQDRQRSVAGMSLRLKTTKVPSNSSGWLLRPFCTETNQREQSRGKESKARTSHVLHHLVDSIVKMRLTFKYPIAHKNRSEWQVKIGCGLKVTRPIQYRQTVYPLELWIKPKEGGWGRTRESFKNCHANGCTCIHEHEEIKWRVESWSRLAIHVHAVPVISAVLILLKAGSGFRIDTEKLIALVPTVVEQTQPFLDKNYWTPGRMLWIVVAAHN